MTAARGLALAAIALAAAALAFAAGAEAATITRGPYLQVTTPTGTIVRWRTFVSTDGVVRYGLAPDALTLSATSPAFGLEHEVALTGLAPATRYWYSVGSTDSTFAGDATYTFATAPPAGPAVPFRLWAVGDAGLAGSVQAAVRDAFAAWTGARGADLWLMLGDNAYYSGTDAEYQAGCFTPFATALRRWPLWTTRGNHDVPAAGPNNDYYDFFTLPMSGEAGGVPSGSEAYYAFDWANVHFVCLDSEDSDRSLGGPMLTWLRADLAATARDWVIAFWHQPPYSKGSHDSDSPAETHMRQMRERVLPILDSLGVDLVLTGHSHSYERSFLLRGHYGLSGTLTSAMKADSGDGRPTGDGAYVKPPGRTPHDGAVYVVAGSSAQTSGGGLNHPVMVASLNVAGSLVLDVDGDQIEARFLDAAGAIADHFTMLKPANAGLEPPGGVSPGLGFVSGAPNPSRGEVALRFALPRAGRASLAIHGADGRRVATLLEGDRSAGTHDARWSGRDERGRAQPPGVYFAVLDLDGEKRALRLVRVR